MKSQVVTCWLKFCIKTSDPRFCPCLCLKRWTCRRSKQWWSGLFCTPRSCSRHMDKPVYTVGSYETLRLPHLSLNSAQSMWVWVGHLRQSVWHAKTPIYSVWQSSPDSLLWKWIPLGLALCCHNAQAWRICCTLVPFPPTDSLSAIRTQGTMLAIKLTSGEWWHLEGAEQPFIIWTDHKNFA